MLFNVTVVLLPGATGLGEKLTVVPGGLPEALRVILLANPQGESVPNVVERLEGTGQPDTTGAGELKSNP